MAPGAFGPARALAAAMLLLAATTVWPQSSIVELNRIVAIVNEDVIVYSELEGRVRTVEAQLREAGTPAPPRHVLERQVLDRLILEKLQRQLADTAGIHVDDEALNRAVSSLAQQNGLSLREFRDILERDGYDFSKFREEIRSELLIAQVRQRYVSSRVTVSPRDIDNFLATRKKQGGEANEYDLWHILIAVPEGASSDQIASAREKADRVLAELRGGADFAQTAVAQSDGQQALQGGDLGYRKASELPTIFADIVLDMQVGDISEPIRSPSGYHIVLLHDVRGGERVLVKQTHVRHILIRVNEVVTDEVAQRRLEQLRERALNGEDFATLARSHSEDAANAVNGGDLGWLTGTEVVPTFRAVMDETKVGDVTEPFQTQFGWHILKVEERREHDDTEAARRNTAAEQIRARKTEEELQTWLRQIRDEAYVEYRLEE